MKDKEIVLCNFDDPTTDAFLDKFESYFKQEPSEVEKNEEVVHEELSSSEKEQVPMTKCKYPIHLFSRQEAKEHSKRQR